MIMMDIPTLGEPSKYAFANATLALIEKTMIPQGQIDQLRVAGNLEEFHRMLSDSVYAQYFDEGKPIEDVVEEETIRFRNELLEIVPEDDRSIFNIFFIKYDFNNMKILLKSHYLGIDYPIEDLSRTGLYPTQTLIDFIEGKLEGEFPLDINMESLEAQVKSSGEMRIIDTILDKAYYKSYLEFMKKIRDPFFTDLVMEQIDLKNILIFIRCKRAELPMERYLLDGGYISPEVFQRYGGENLDILTTANDFSAYRSVIANGLAEIDKTGSYSELETAIHNHTISALTEVRDYMFTIKPFIAYLMAKEHEISLIKRIYVYLNSGMDFGAERDIVYV